jgi:hypothetical protein
MSRYTVCGKEVLRDGRHYADAMDPHEAHNIANALNTVGVQPVDVCATCKRVDGHELNCVERN